VLDCTAFAGTALLFAAWFARDYPAAGAPWSTLGWLLGFGLGFALLPLLPHWRERSRVRPERFALALGNVAFVFGYAALMLAEDYRLALALVCLGGAGLHQVLARVTLARCGSDLRVEHGFRAVAILLLSLGLLYLLPVNAVATGWALEAVLLVALGYRFAAPSVRLYALPLWLLAAGRTPILEQGAAGARTRFIHWAQEMFDQAGMVREAVKWDYELRQPKQMQTVVRRAFSLAESAPAGPVYQAGTLSGNPLAVAGGIATLRYLQENPNVYEHLEALGQRLDARIEEIARGRIEPWPIPIEL